MVAISSRRASSLLHMWHSSLLIRFIIIIIIIISMLLYHVSVCILAQFLSHHFRCNFMCRYSPEYALRSYYYLMPHALPTWLLWLVGVYDKVTPGPLACLRFAP